MRERDKGTATENFGCWRFIVYEKNQKALRGGVFINPPPPHTHTHTHTHSKMAGPPATYDVISRNHSN